MGNDVARLVEIHLFSYATHAVVVFLAHAPVGDIAKASNPEPTADGGEMLRTWSYHHTLDAAWESVRTNRDMWEAMDDPVTVWHHDCT